MDVPVRSEPAACDQGLAGGEVQSLEFAASGLMPRMRSASCRVNGSLGMNMAAPFAAVAPARCASSRVFSAPAGAGDPACVDAVVPFKRLSPAENTGSAITAIPSRAGLRRASSLRMIPSVEAEGSVTIS